MPALTPFSTAAQPPHIWQSHGVFGKWFKKIEVVAPPRLPAFGVATSRWFQDLRVPADGRLCGGRYLGGFFRGRSQTIIWDWSLSAPSIRGLQQNTVDLHWTPLKVVH